MMDTSVLPLAEVDLKIGDVAIKFENDVEEEEEEEEDREQFEEIQSRFEADFYGNIDIHQNLNFLRQGNEYEKVNFHFLSASTNSLDSRSPIKKFQCSNCLKYFTRNDHLKNHMRTHTGERPYGCDSCQRTFAKHFDLTRHKQYVHGCVTTFFICEECGRTFSRKDHLKSHLITHKNQPPKLPGDSVTDLLKKFTCETCGRTYCRLENLKKHMQKHCENMNGSGCIPKGIINDLKDETITENIFKGINFHFMSVNDVKIRVDNAVRSFACEFCERLFVRKDHLKNHERTHTGERPYQCEQCDKRFAKRFVMTRHLRNVHRINTKMHKCTECERMFSRTDHLKTHMKIHILAAVRSQQKEKMHKCDVCDRGFTRSDNLKTHMKIHLLAAVKRQQEEGEGQGKDIDLSHPGISDADLFGDYVARDYFCEVCESSFPTLEKLEEHERSHGRGGTSEDS